MFRFSLNFTPLIPAGRLIEASVAARMSGVCVFAYKCRSELAVEAVTCLKAWALRRVLVKEMLEQAHMEVDFTAGKLLRVWEKI